MRTPYLGDTLVWTFRDDAEREEYIRIRGRRHDKVVSIAVLFPIFAVLIYASLFGGMPAVVTLVAGIALLWELFNWQLERSHKISSVELRLHANKLWIAERHAGTRLLRDRRFAVREAAYLKSMQWVSAGCRLACREFLPSFSPVVLPMGLFSTQDAIDALYRWAEEHKITIDGVPPLPGAYVRPIEERRGL